MVGRGGGVMERGGREGVMVPLLQLLGGLREAGVAGSRRGAPVVRFDHQRGWNLVFGSDRNRFGNLS